VGCSSVTPTVTPWPAPAFVVGECAFKVPFRVAPMCGTVAVPQDRSVEGGGTFDLSVVVFPSEADEAAPDPVVYLAGGPGENALDTLEFTFDDLFRPFLSTRDVIVFDQRGAGYSEPDAECPEFVELEIDLLDESVSVDEEGERGLAAAEECFERLTNEGVALSALSTAESAADVHAIMSALGYDEWNLLGISYGTRLAQTIMRDRPEGVRAVILDSVVPLEADMIAQTPGSFDRALQALLDGCATSSTCATDYPNLEQTLMDAVTRLKDAPVAGTVSNQLTLETFASVASGTDLAEQVFQGLYSAEVIPLLPEMIALANQGETGLLDLLRGVTITNSPFISTGMQIALQCTEEVPFTTEEEVTAANEPYPRVREMLEGSRPLGSEVFDLCTTWGLAAASAVENEPVESGIPRLVLAGRYDPITPPSGGRQVAERLTNGTFVEFAAAGHAALTTGECALDIVAAFLDDPTAAVNGACAGDQPPPAWVRPIEATQFEPFTSSLFGFSSVKPIGWSELAPGVFGRSELGIVTILEQVAPNTSGEALIDLLQSSLPGTPEFLSFGAYVSDHYTWDLVQTIAGGQLVLMAVADDGASAPFVMITGLPSQEKALVEVLLGSVLEALAPAP
jgi:pimeloyl-ACP methyl ester carboxylesterase